jgi:MFS family permease
VPDELQGRVRSVATLISFSTMALGPLLAGYLLEGIGGDATFVVIGGYALVVALVGMMSASLRHFPRADRPRLAERESRCIFAPSSSAVRGSATSPRHTCALSSSSRP